MLDKKNLRILLLGVGIGLILSSSLNLFFQSSNQKKITPEYIRAEARRLGMIEPKKYFDKSVTDQNQTADNQQLEIEEEAAVVIVIRKGNTSEDVAKLLKENNLVESENMFLNRIYARKAASKLQTGSYAFNKNMTVDEMIDAMLIGNKPSGN
ncbi:MAG: endolytic transglycosylase MltG [Geosporobacter ferrireducens]|nr:endolytic transglycosylase MltG [Geosporobacter ferrireducens]